MLTFFKRETKLRCVLKKKKKKKLRGSKNKIKVKIDIYIIQAIASVDELLIPLVFVVIF